LIQLLKILRDEFRSIDLNEENLKSEALENSDNQRKTSLIKAYLENMLFISKLSSILLQKNLVDSEVQKILLEFWIFITLNQSHLEML
jgi:hypothetical protein